MCSRIRLLVAIALLSAGGALTSPGHAQTTNPSSEAIVKALTPTGTIGPSRGIRPVNPAPDAAAPSGTAGGASSAGKSSGGAPSGAVVAATSGAAGAAPSINLNVQFETGSAQLTAPAMQTLNQLGLALSQPALAPYRFRIEGHTDTVGTAAYNKQLSDQRAAAVADYLTTNFKVDRGRLEPVGEGEAGLLVPTPDQTSEPKNRRVAVVNIGS